MRVGGAGRERASCWEHVVWAGGRSALGCSTHTVHSVCVLDTLPKDVAKAETTTLLEKQEKYLPWHRQLQT